jgi:phenylacetate-CoA ligase
MGSIAENAYNHSPIWLQNLAITAYGTRLRYRRYSGKYAEYLSSLLSTERASARELRELQNTALRRLVQHATKYVPYYAESREYRRIEKSLLTIETLPDLLPVLSKATVRANAKQFHSNAYKSGELLTLNTSGTSGTPLDIKATAMAVQKNYAFFSRMLRWYGVAPIKDRGVTFAGRLIIPPDQRGPPFWRYNRAMKTLLMSAYRLTEESIPLYIEEMERFGPQFIDSYPSAIHAVASWINRNSARRTVRPKVIVTSSETVLDFQREAIEGAFACPLRDHYGCAEMAAWITQCEHGRYHVNPEYGIVEIIRADGSRCLPGEVGQLCCTGLVNEAMPLIRYSIGDSAAFADGTCECGRQYPLIEGLVGRTDDLIVTPEGQQIGRLDPAFKGVGGMVEAQIIQTAEAEVEVLVVPQEKFDARASESLRAEILKRLSPSMRVTIRVVDAIPREPNGKFRAVVSRVKRAVVMAEASPS